VLDKYVVVRLRLRDPDTGGGDVYHGDATRADGAVRSGKLDVAAVRDNA
jgi:hypothetical protein